MSVQRTPLKERPARRWIAAAFSVGAHIAILAGLLTRRETPPIAPDPQATVVTLVREPERPAGRTVGAEEEAATKAVGATAAAAPAKPTPPRPSPGKSSTPAAEVAAAGPGDSDVMSGAALGSATAADALPGGECDMARRLQTALRRDPLVRAAVAARALSGSSAILVWNGGWVASPGEDGKGLAAVREALVWAVAFSPAPCRAGRVHGPVLFSVSDGGALTRIAVGAGDWRWGDLVTSR